MRALGLALIAALLLAGMQPAAGSSTPSKVGLVSFVAASHSSTSASLTIDWPSASHATSYEIFMSRYTTMSHATKYTSTSSFKRISHLRSGVDYFFQVRGVNGSSVGTKSTHVGHTTILDQGYSSGTPYRVMTYNFCSRVCDLKTTTNYTWSQRQPGALQRITAKAPDVLATQEADYLAMPDASGYTEAIYKSGKRLLYKANRFTLTANPNPVPKPPKDTDGCSPTWSDVTTGYVFLGFHGHPDVDPAKNTRGCRYAVWAELVDKTNGKHVIFVDVHTVAGDSDNRAEDRKAEITTLFAAMPTINPQARPVVYSGDFNSNKSRSDDSVATVMHLNRYYDAYDLAMTLKRQHFNSYNDFQTTPRISYTWGDHVDHVWLKPGTSRVGGWRNEALIVDGRLPTPIPSDHSPVVVDLQLN